MRTRFELARWTVFSAVLLYMLASQVSATYIDPIICFIKTSLEPAFITMGNSIAVVMFVYGAAKYVYTADDPGARKQAVGICVAAMMAMIIIQVAGPIMLQVAKSQKIPWSVSC